MTNDIQTLKDDIAYLKALADSGQGKSLGGGIILMAAGLLYASASVVQWMAMAHVGTVGGAASNLAWIIATLVFMAVLMAVKLRWRAEGWGSNSASVAWKGVGIGCFFIFAALALATWRSQSALLIEFAPSIVFILYGAAWIAMGTALRLNWVQVTGWASFAGALITAWFIGQASSYLIYAAGLIVLAFLPGLIFALQAQRAGA